MRLRPRGLPFSLAILSTVLLAPLAAVHPSAAAAGTVGATASPRVQATSTTTSAAVGAYRHGHFAQHRLTASDSATPPPTAALAVVAAPATATPVPPMAPTDAASSPASFSTAVIASPPGLTATAPATSTALAPSQVALAVPSAPGGLTWTTTRTALPQSLYRAAVATGQDGTIYVFGGTDGSSVDYATTFIYNPGTNTWTQGAALPVAREGAQAVTLPDGRIAVLGGGTHCWYDNFCRSGTVYNRVDVYTPGTDSWSTLPALTTARYRFAAVWSQGQLYVLGGSDGAGALASVEAYSPTLGTWSPVAALPQNTLAGAATVDGAGHIAVLGGFDGNTTFYNTLWLYDGSTWTSGPALPQGTQDAAATLGPDGNVYLIGGFSDGYLSTVQVYTPGTQTWTTAADLPTPTCCAGAVTAATGQLYLIGGGGTQVAIYGPRIALTPTSGAPGTPVTLTGTGFTPNGGVSLTLGTATGAALGQGTADGSGNLSLTVVLPRSALGPTTLTALDSSAQYPVTAPFTVTQGLQSGTIPWHPHQAVRFSDGLNASVDLADGHLDLHVQGLTIPGRGPALRMNHVWDSTLAQAGITTTAGQGWFDSFTPSIGGTLTGTLTYTDGSGAAWPLHYSGPITATSPYTAYTVPAGQPWQLTTSAVGYTLTDILSGATRTFDVQGRYLADADSYANSNTLAYTSSAALPMTATNSGGRALSLYYGGNGLLSAAQSPLDRATTNRQGQLVAYGYSPNTAQLATVAWGYGSADQRVATFAYSGTQLLTVTTPGGHAWSIGYDSLGRVSYIASPQAGAPTQAGYTPAYATVFAYQPGQTSVVQGYKQRGQLVTTDTLDGQGEATASADIYGNTTRYTYDADHDVLTRTDANTHVTTNDYQYVGAPGPSGLGSTGLITETARPPGSDQVPVTTTYGYDPQSYDLLTTTTGAGAASGYGLTYFAYDGHHAVITTTQQLGLSGCGAGTQSATLRHTRTLDQSCQPGLTWRASVNRYDPFGALVASVDGRGLDVAPTSAQGVPSPTLNALAPLSTHSYTYTAQGDLAAAWTPPITTLSGTLAQTAPVTTSYADDLDGNAVARTSPNGTTTEDSYDHLGRLTLTTPPSVALYDGSASAPAAARGYDGDGNVITATDGAGDLTRASYDPLGRLVATTDPVSGTTLYTYTATTLAQVRDPAGHVTSYGYDGADRLVARADPTGATTRYGYDPVGNTVAITTPLDYSHPNTLTVETRGYDALDRVISATVGGSGESSPTAPQTTLYRYDHDGNTTQVQAPNGDVSTRWYDYADRLSQANVFPNAGAAPLSPPPAASAGYTVDAADNVIDHLDFSQYDHQTSFDGANRPTQAVDTCALCPSALPITTTPTYDPDGNVLSLTRQEGTTQTAASSAVYNALDWLSSQDDGQGTTAYGYDAAGRLRTQSLLGGTATGVVTSTVNAAGWVTASSDTLTETGQTPSSSSSLFTYTPDGLPSALTLNSGAGQLQETRQYDGDNRLAYLASSGPGSASPPLARTYLATYSPQGRTQAITAAIAGNDAVDAGSWQFNYDALGELRTQTTPNGASGYYTWSYDGNGNLLSWHTDSAQTATSGVTYNYTDTTSLTPSAWLPNELVSAASSFGLLTQYGYDGSGNTTAITTSDARYPGYGLQYNAQGLPTVITTTQGLTVGLGYNARGWRATVSVTEPAQSQPDFVEHLRYRGAQIGQVAVSGSHPFTETFVYRPDGAPLELLWQVPGQGTQRYWYVLDGQGSVVALVDGTGAEVNYYGYDRWGKPGILARQETIPQPLRYRGYWYDAWYHGWDFSNGRYNAAPTSYDGFYTSDGPLPWYWLRARYYDPYLERFLEPDPSAQDGVRSYTYCHDAPVDCADPSGLAGVGPGDEQGPIVEAGANPSPPARCFPSPNRTEHPLTLSSYLCRSLMAIQTSLRSQEAEALVAQADEILLTKTETTSTTTS